MSMSTCVTTGFLPDVRPAFASRPGDPPPVPHRPAGAGRRSGDCPPPPKGAPHGRILSTTRGPAAGRPCGRLGAVVRTQGVRQGAESPVPTRGDDAMLLVP